MKKLSILFSLLALLLVGTACEDDYRDLTLFSGAEPIYQAGTCDNLLTTAVLYLTNPEGIVVGIDGGDGDYTLSDNNPAVATAEFTASEDGFRRFRVTPVGAGTTYFQVKDGSGLVTTLKVTVREYAALRMRVHEHRFSYESDEALPDDQWRDLAYDLDQQFAMRPGGLYVLKADDADVPLPDSGTLLVYPTEDSDTPIEGTYEVTGSEALGECLLFRYAGEEHLFSFRSPDEWAGIKTSPISSFYVYEDVTALSPVALPQGSRIIHGELWLQEM